MSGKSDGADDAAVLVSRKQLASLTRDAELGRILREIPEELAKIEKAWLGKKPRTAKDVRQAALESLMIIGDRFRGAGMFKAHVCALPRPLFLLMMELYDVQNKCPSPLLTANDPPKGEPSANTANAKGRAAAVVTYNRLTECDAWADDKAAGAIAKIFQDYGIKVRSPKSSARQRTSDGTVTPETVKQWAKISRAEWGGRRGKGRFEYEIKAFRKLTDELYQVRGYGRSLELISVVNGFYTFELSGLRLVEGYAYEDRDRCDLLLDFLRRYIAGTAYEA